MRTRIRETAIQNVNALLDHFSTHPQEPEDAIRMVDRVIGGLLGHPDSPYVQDYRTYSRVLFPAGLEATGPGKDIVLILNQGHVSVRYGKKTQSIEIPRALKNPEKGIAQIAGRDLTRELFRVRGEILSLLVLIDPGWGLNIAANVTAQNVLKFYEPEGSSLSHLNVFKNPKPKVKLEEQESSSNRKSCWNMFCPCMN